MNEEYLKSIIEIVAGIETSSETQSIAKYELIEYVEQLKDRIDKAIEWVYIVHQNEDNKHLEPIISIDELDELLEVLKGDKENERFN